MDTHLVPPATGSDSDATGNVVDHFIVDRREGRLLKAARHHARAARRRARGHSLRRNDDSSTHGKVKVARKGRTALGTETYRRGIGKAST